MQEQKFKKQALQQGIVVPYHWLIGGNWNLNRPTVAYKIYFTIALFIF